MKNLFDQTEREALMQRLSRVSAGSPRRWGKMNAHEMIVHLTDPFRVALGVRPAPFRRSFLGTWPFNKFISQIMPWPKGAPTAPEFIQGVKGTPPLEFEKDKAELFRLIEEFSRRTGSPFAPSPVFGKLNNKEWARLMFRHLHHHLTQFGL